MKKLFLTLVSLCAFALSAAPKVPELIDAVTIKNFTIPEPGKEIIFRLPQITTQKL